MGSLEIWTDGKAAQIDKYVIKKQSVKHAGELGYPGLSGFYLPKWLSASPYNVELYRALMLDTATPSAFFNRVKVNATKVDCRTSSGACQCCNVHTSKCQA